MHACTSQMAPEKILLSYYVCLVVTKQDLKIEEKKFGLGWWSYWLCTLALSVHAHCTCSLTDSNILWRYLNQSLLFWDILTVLFISWYLAGLAISPLFNCLNLFWPMSLCFALFGNFYYLFYVFFTDVKPKYTYTNLFWPFLTCFDLFYW